MFSKDLFKNAINVLHELGSKDNKTTLCIEIFSSILESEDLWETTCPYHYNNKYFINNMTQELENIANSSSKSNDMLALYSLSILRERTFMIQREDIDIEGKHVITKEDRIWDNFLQLVNEYNFDDRYYFRWILEQLPLVLFNFHLKTKDFQLFSKYEELVNKVDNELNNTRVEMDRITNDLNEKTKATEKLNNKLNNIKIGADFVGLSKGFSRLLRNKKIAKWITVLILFLLGIIVLAPISYEAYKLSEFYVNKENLSFTWQEMLPIFGLELILIYFFRIVLNHYFSLQTQIMQLDLRLSLCQFIQSYISYAKDIKSDALEKFENLIFSSIVSDPKRVPGTFDGVESLASLVQALKGDKS